LNTIKKEDRFRQALIPSFYLGLLTNLYIIGLLILIKSYSIILSPVIGSFIFLGLLCALLKNKISTKTAFYILACAVSLEVIIHTHFLGWSLGFYYYLFLINLVFFLNYKWSKVAIVVFNLSVFLIGFGLWYYYSKEVSQIVLSPSFVTNTNLINLVGTASLIIIIVVYYSRVLHHRDETLQNNMIALQVKNKEILAHQKKQELLIKEIHHRVKNNLQIISSLMSLQSNSVTDERVLEVLNQSRARVQAIALIHQKLYQNDMVGQVDFKSYLADILSTQQLINDKLNCNLESTEVLLHLDIAVPLGIIVSELMTNSLKHAFKGIENPCLDVKLFSNNDTFTLIIKDNGIGLKDDFNLENPTRLGMEIITVLIEQIDAELLVSNEIGACFTITFKNMTD
jgi:two-component sensor histidine kinase